MLRLRLLPTAQAIKAADRGGGKMRFTVVIFRHKLKGLSPTLISVLANVREVSLEH